MQTPLKHPHRRSLARSRAGFTMLELLVALGVLLVAVMATFSSQVTSFNLTTTSRETQTAMTDLQAAMEQLLLVNLADLPLVDSEYEAGQPIAAFEGLHLSNERIVATYPAYVAGLDVPDPLEIVLTATWNDYARRPRSLTLTSMTTR